MKEKERENISGEGSEQIIRIPLYYQADSLPVLNWSPAPWSFMLRIDCSGHGICGGNEVVCWGVDSFQQLHRSHLCPDSISKVDMSQHGLVGSRVMGTSLARTLWP